MSQRGLDINPEEVNQSLAPERSVDFTGSGEFTKTASDFGVERAVQNTSWADTSTPNETIELSKHISQMVEDKLHYVEIEELLKKIGYDTPTIRKVFYEVTEIDPVRAYLDTSNYSIPPAAVPRYNYAWGVSKKADQDYYYVLPYVNKYAVWCLKGFEQKVVEEFHTVGEAQEAIKKYVKAVTFVTPGVQNLQEDIIQRVASSLFSMSQKGKEVFSKAEDCSDTDLKQLIVADALQDNLITEAEAEAIHSFWKLADEVADADTKDSEKQFLEYKSNQETQTVDEVRDKVKVPTNKFDEVLENKHRVNLMELTKQAFDNLEAITSTISNYILTPVANSVDFADVQNFTPEGGEVEDKGSISFIVEVQDPQRKKTSLILLIMFVKGGQLQYSGKFKGQNNKEYALTQQGLDVYMEDLTGENLVQRSPLPTSLTTIDDQVGPHIR